MPENSSNELIVVHVSRLLTSEQCAVITKHCNHVSEKLGCRVAFFHGVDSVQLQSADGFKYGYSESLKDYSYSVFGQTPESVVALKDLLSINPCNE